MVVSPAGYRVIRSPLNGIYTIDNTLPTTGNNYANFVVALNDLNVIGNSGPVTFNVTAGQVFNMTLGTGAALLFTTRATAANPIVFQKYGSGAKPVLGFTATSATTDWGVVFYGASYITLDGLKIQDNGTSTANWMDRGISLIPQSATLDNNHITIQNCVVQMTKANTSSYCIYQYYNAIVPPTGSGTNNFIHYYNDTLINAQNGMYVYGYGTANYDKGTEIGNCYINNLGGNAATVYGMYTYNQDSIKIFNNTVTNLSATTGSYYIYGLYAPYGNWVNIYNNTFSNFSNYYYQYLAYIYGLNYTNPTAVSNVYNNKFSGMTQLGGSGYMYGMYLAYGDGTINFYNNEMSNISNNYYMYAWYMYPKAATCKYNIHHNKTFNITSSATSTYVYYGAYMYNSYAGSQMNVYNNMWYDIKIPASATTNYCVYASSNSQLMKFYNNTIYVNYTSTNASNVFYGIYLSNSTSYVNCFDMRNNIIIVKPTMTTGTRSACIGLSAAVAGPIYYPFTASCNNNLLYAGTPSAKNLLMYASATDTAMTIGKYKTLFAPRENADVTEDVPFVQYNSRFNGCTC